MSGTDLELETPWWTNAGVISALATLGVAYSTSQGLAVTQASLTETLTTAGVLVGAAVALYGRAVAINDLTMSNWWQRLTTSKTVMGGLLVCFSSVLAMKAHVDTAWLVETSTGPVKGTAHTDIAGLVATLITGGAIILERVKSTSKLISTKG
jgi:hypothetical protein